MTKSSSKKKKQQKAKQQNKKDAILRAAAPEKAEFYVIQASHYQETGKKNKALANIKKAAKLLPKDVEVLKLLCHIAQSFGDIELEISGMARLDRIGQLPDEFKLYRFFLMVDNAMFKEALEYSEILLANFPKMNIKSKAREKKRIAEAKLFCQYRLDVSKLDPAVVTEAIFKNDPTVFPPEEQNKKQKKPALQKEEDETNVAKIAPANLTTPKSFPEIPVSFNLDTDSFHASLLNPKSKSHALYELALESHAIRFKESFETLVCLSSLFQVRSYWYQEETAKKVLKRFRGRALLSDEVGLGKTIEALIIFSEYVKRGMVKTALFLTPTPLVSQWKDEMQSKFGLDIPSTDDDNFKSGDKAFWSAPFILASINQAKSKKNFELVAAREYDMVIVDEAHHLKNRTTLNWKLVNSLKKRFILLLTATPVENNLMELYNLITLLKPGQLETATSFKEKFMKRGDPTDPRNRSQLKELLGEVMIRNTRALAGINIPPRFAETIRIQPSKHDLAFYKRLESLITALNSQAKGRGRMITKNLLAQAGSSPNAVILSISRMLEKKSAFQDHEKELQAVKNLCRTTVDTPKNKALLKLIQSSREKIIVFVKYRGTLDHLTEFLEWHNISAALFHGGMDNRRKDLAIESFRNEKQVLVTTEIGGEGRNLQFCCRMVNYDLPWNPMKIEQRIGRIHRIGQEKEVRIFNFCAAGSIEDYILDILDRKINMFEMVVGEIDMIVGRIRGEKEFEEMVYDIWVDAESDEHRKNSFNNLGIRLKRAKTGYEKTRELDDKLFGDSYEL